ncbi:uncharacterized protein LOC132701536 isoform X3 [Cylas formicarius]|uniref:uncharacterized protein LOC132701536 isoform X3 n=1 Tax=Cylas formicarius TaxID=197179 RepID=UPI002958B824|nr:uncharacterized protein LOC132701536 isoform X3 [Cylas formicarius]
MEELGFQEKIGFIGGGNMAKAICEGVVRKGLIRYSQVYVSGPNIQNLLYWKEKGSVPFRGVCANNSGPKASPSDISLVKKMFEVSGVCQQVPESLINAIGALAGSGPAFVYLILEALADGGVKQGVPRNLAVEFAAQTVLGAAKMSLESGKHTGQLKDEVCSAGGTTIAGIHKLESGGVRGALMDAIEAATKRSQELAQEKHG